MARATTLLAALALVACATRATGDDAAVSCQRAIEGGGKRYAAAVLDAVARCAHRRGVRFDRCVDTALRTGRLARVRQVWGRTARRTCTGVRVFSDLGFLDACAVPPDPSRCAFAASALDARGRKNDLLDCLACQVGERLRDAGARLFAGGAAGDACQRTIGDEGLHRVGVRRGVPARHPVRDR